MKIIITLICSFLYTTKAISQSMEKQKPVFNHAALYVLDLKKSSDFYLKVIGLDSVPEPFHDGRHAWFKIGPATTLHIISGADTTKDYYKSNHLCFSIPSIEKFIEQLTKHNVEWQDNAGKKFGITVRIDGIKQIYFKDPDGYWLEINNAVQ